MQVVIVTAVIIAVLERLLIDNTFFRIVQVTVTGTTAVTTFQVGIECCMRQSIHPTGFQRVIEIITLTRSVRMGGRCRIGYDRRLFLVEITLSQTVGPASAEIPSGRFILLGKQEIDSS